MDFQETMMDEYVQRFLNETGLGFNKGRAVAFAEAIYKMETEAREGALEAAIKWAKIGKRPYRLLPFFKKNCLGTLKVLRRDVEDFKIRFGKFFSEQFGL